VTAFGKRAGLDEASGFFTGLFVLELSLDLLLLLGSWLLVLALWMQAPTAAKADPVHPPGLALNFQIVET
jgi:hypothetical protein